MTPVLARQLATNHAPTQDEIVVIKDRLSASQGQLHALSVRIDQLRGHCERLCSEQEVLSIGISKYRGMLSPARRLVPDILREIFNHCLPTSHNAVMSYREAPLLLGQVCSYWRQVVTSTPRLWTSIHITISSAQAYSTARLIDNSLMLFAIDSWLSRTGILPLSISLHSSIFSTLPYTPTNPYIRPFLDILTPYASRWKSLSLKLENYDWTEFFNRYGAADVPVLEALQLEGTQVPGPVSGDSQAPDFLAAIREYGILHAPRIRSISVPRYATHILQLPIRWTELIELNMSNGAFSLRDIFKALGLCPQLVRCSISVSDWNRVIEYDDLYTPKKVVLPKLEALSLKDDLAQHDTLGILGSLVAPQLCHLSFRPAMYSEPPVLIRAIETFCRNLIHPLQEFQLEANSMSPECVMEVLELLPGLKRLSLESSGKPETPPEQAPFLSQWTIPTSFYFTDGPLRRLIPKVVSVLEIHPHSQANPFLGDLGKDSEPESDTSNAHVPPTGLFNSSPSSSGVESKVVINRLCPNLEVFHCSGAMFSESSLLELLRARSLKQCELGVAHLRRVSILFVPGRKKSPTFTEEIFNLAKQTGSCVYLGYPQPIAFPPLNSRSIYSYSPYQGLENEEDRNYPPQHIGF